MVNLDCLGGIAAAESAVETVGTDRSVGLTGAFDIVPDPPVHPLVSGSEDQPHIVDKI